VAMQMGLSLATLLTEFWKIEAVGELEIDIEQCSPNLTASMHV